MNRRRLLFFAGLLFTLPCRVPAGNSVPIMPGEYKTGEVQPGEQDVYALSAKAGDVLTIFVGVAGGSLDPEVELHGPDGAVVSTNWGSSSAVIEAVQVTAAGTYLILLRDHYGQYTGTYGLTVITNPGPNPGDEDGSAIVAGEYKTANIATGDIDVYSYQAKAGEVLTIFVGVAGGSLDPEVELHGPDGAVVSTNWGSSSAVIEAVKVTVAGTYLILLRDHYGPYAGAYGLTVITYPGPNPGDEDASAIVAGEYKTAQIAVGDIDVYSYQAAAGEVLTIFVGVGGGSLDPEVELHGPDGAVVSTGWGTSSAMIEAVKVTVAGTYLILVRDHYGPYAGAYGLTVITNTSSNPGDEDASVIVAGEYKTATIAVGDMDVYSFQARAGDVLTIFVGVTGGSLDPEVELYGPDGAVVSTGWGPSSAVIETVKVTVAGTYLILLRDHYGQYTGAYSLTVITNPGPNPGDEDGWAIRSGEYAIANIAVGDMDVYNFWANAGDAVTAVVDVNNGSLDPQVELHGPDGAVVSTDWHSSSAAIKGAKVTVTGTHLIVIRDHYGTYTGQYILSLERVKRPGTPTVGTVVAEPDALVRGEDLTLRAEDISDANGTIVRVEFWYDRLWDGYLEADGSDVLLGVDSNGVDGWSWSGSTRGFTPSFFEVVYARALDDEGLWSDEAGALVWVLPAGDLNGDLFTDALDLQDFASHWLQTECTEPDWCDGADINRSGRVDLEDLAEFAWDWLQ